MSRASTAILIVLAALAAATAPPRGLAARALAPAGLVPGDRVLCLYDSTEGSTEARNPLSGRVAATLRRAGFQVDWADVVRGLPDPASVRGFRAVVTGFVDGAMDGAARYPAFVRGVVAEGVRFVVIGNYGAFQERGATSFLAEDVVNGAFEALGVRYDALWTDDPARFRVDVPDPAVAAAAPPDARKVRHFYQFTPVRPDVRVLAGAARTDLASGPPRSAVVFTSATGAFALSRYLSSRDLLDDPAADLLDVEAFVRLAVARVPADPAALVVVHDPASSDSRRAVEALAAASAYAGIPLATVRLDHAGALRPADLAAHAGLVLAVPEVPSPLDGLLAGLVRDLTGRGGRALALLPLRNAALAPAFAQGGPARPEPVRTDGIRFTAAAFPGMDGLAAAGLPYSTFRPALGPGCRVLAASVPAGGGDAVPLWWRCPSGRGETIALNAFELVDRPALGVVLQSLLMVEGSWAMPVLAAAVEFVDDCPLPMTGGLLKPVGRLDTDFYLDDFYGMVREAVTRDRIRPTFMAVFSYEDRVRPPFGEPLAGPAGVAARRLAARIVEDDHALGLHGMTHVSPALAGGVTPPFPDGAALRASFRAGRDALRQVAGPEARGRVHVPPNDWIDAAGKQALRDEVPEVSVLAAVFSGTEVETQQDFGPDPDLPGVADLPRTWAGYALAGEAVLGMAGGVMLQAVSTHFIHPDDVLDPERSGGRPWADLRAAYLAGVSEVRRRFPFLREMTALEAGDEVLRLAGLGVRVTVRPGGRLEAVRTPGAGAGTRLMVRTRPGCVPAVHGGEAVATDPASGVHFVRMDRRVMTVQCGRE